MAINRKKHKNLRNELVKMIIEDHPGIIEEWKHDQMVEYAMLRKYRANAEKLLSIKRGKVNGKM